MLSNPENKGKVGSLKDGYGEKCKLASTIQKSIPRVRFQTQNMTFFLY